MRVLSSEVPYRSEPQSLLEQQLLTFLDVPTLEAVQFTDYAHSVGGRSVTVQSTNVFIAGAKVCAKLAELGYVQENATQNLLLRSTQMVTAQYRGAGGCIWLIAEAITLTIVVFESANNARPQ